jgi:hypothetical protein
MEPSAFISWVRRRDREQHEHIPVADRILPLVAQAGQRGMTRYDIGRFVELDPEVLDNLLASLMQAGLLRSSWASGVKVFRA